MREVAGKAIRPAPGPGVLGSNLSFLLIPSLASMWLLDIRGVVPGYTNSNLFSLLVPLTNRQTPNSSRSLTCSL